MTADIAPTSSQTFAYRVRSEPAGGRIVVDPGLEWATLLGGGTLAPDQHAVEEILGGVTVAPDSSILVCGRAGLLDFPVTAGSFSTSYAGSSADGFVSRLSEDGSSLVWSTYLGGSSFEQCFSVAATLDGSVLVAGQTSSLDFPLTPGAFQTNLRPPIFWGAFVSCLSEGGDQILASTYFEGAANEEVAQVGAAPNGDVLLLGGTGSLDLPITPGAADPIMELSEGYLTRFTPDLTALVFSTFLGGSSSEQMFGLVVDEAGFATAVGRSKSPDFPVTPGAFSTSISSVVFYDGVVAKLDPGGAWVYSTYLGGVGGDAITSVDLDPLGRAMVTGDNSSNDFPTTPGAWSTTCTGLCTDGFFTKLDLTGSSLIASTLLGGGIIRPAGIAADSMGGATMVASDPSAFTPWTEGAFDTLAEESEYWIIRMHSSGTRAVYTTLLGGQEDESGTSNQHPVAAMPDDSVVVCGITNSPDFPVTPGAFQTAQAGNWDLFIARLDLLPTGVTRYGEETPGCLGVPTIGIDGMPKQGGRFSLLAGRVPSNSIVWLAAGAAPLAAPVNAGGAGLWVDPSLPFALVPFLTADDQTLTIPLSLHGSGVLPGTTAYLQFFFVDNCATFGVAATPALEVVVQP